MFFEKLSSLFPVFLPAALVLWPCCSVLEDRTVCPCVLTLDLSDEENAVCDSLLVDVWASGGYSHTAYVRREDYGVPYVVKVPSRSGAGVSVISAQMSEMYTSGGGGTGGTHIPQGEQCPIAYMYSSFCQTFDETCCDTVHLRKNYCGVSMSFVSSDLDKYEVSILGNVSGYTPAGIPVEGEFTYCPMTDRPDVCFFRLPRQTDASLQLSIGVPGGRLRTFALGSYIEDSGYDWKKPDLEDIAITIDYASTSITIYINGWSTCIEYEVVI